MSMYHFGNDNDMNIYPEHEWGELYETDLLCVEVEGQLFVDFKDAKACLDAVTAENERLRELVDDLDDMRIALCDAIPDDCFDCPAHDVCDTLNAERYRIAGIEVE